MASTGTGQSGEELMMSRIRQLFESRSGVPPGETNLGILLDYLRGVALSTSQTDLAGILFDQAAGSRGILLESCHS